MSDEFAGSGAPLPHLEPFEENFYHCSACNYCVEMTWEEWGIDGVCPTLRHHSPGQGYSGKGYIAAARAWYEAAPPDLPSLIERAFTCTACGNCEEVCPIGMRPRQIAVALRSEIIARGLEPDWAAQRAAAFAAQNLPACEPQLTPDQIAIICSPAQPHSLAEGTAAASLLGACGNVRLVEMPLHDLAELSALGYAAQLTEPLARLCNRLAEMGTRQIVLVDADGLSLLAASAGELDVQSALSLLLASLRSGRLVLTPRPDNPPPAEVGYLDSCHLTKKTHGLASLRLAEQARALLDVLGIGVIGASGAAARFAICCGAAGGMPASKPQAARSMANARLADLGHQGARLVITASPLCSDHLASDGGEGVGVLGLYTFLARHFQPRAGRTAS